MADLPGPRPHHVEMKHLIASLAHSKPGKFLATFRGESGQAYLQGRDRAGLSRGRASHVRGAGAGRGRPDAPGRHRLPGAGAPQRGALPGRGRDDHGLRVLLLERSLLPSTGEQLAMLLELGPAQRLDDGPVADGTLATLRAAVPDVLAGRARPLTAEPLGRRPGTT